MRILSRRTLKQFAILAAVACGVFSALRAQQSDSFAWAPLPVQPNTWVGPNQPIWKLSDLLAKHKGQANWSQTVVDDVTLHADYVSMVPGAKFSMKRSAWGIIWRSSCLPRSSRRLRVALRLLLFSRMK